MKLVGYKAHDLYETMSKIAALDDEGKRGIVDRILKDCPAGTQVTIASFGGIYITFPVMVSGDVHRLG